MKSSALVLLTLAATLSRLPAESIWEWTFENNAAESTLGDGVLGWSTVDALSQAAFEKTDGAAVPHVDGAASGFLRLPAYQDPLNFPQLSFGGSAPNGGGAFINQFTVIMDVFIPGGHTWLPFFNTNTNNDPGNDADFYVSPDGGLGIGALGYTDAGVIPPDTWLRIAMAADLSAGRVSYYLDGVPVFVREGEPLTDGRFSIYSAVDEGPDLILANEGDESGVYTSEWLLGGFAFTDRTLDDGEVMLLAGPKADGIFTAPTPAAPQLQATLAGNLISVGWGQTGYLLQRSTDLAVWTTVEGADSQTTYTEPAPVPGGRLFFRLARP